MKVLIIGAGWYGCHLASVLQSININFVIVDKSNKIFTGSSSKNQNRLHLGFHYPRSKSTINECQKGYYKFLEKYSIFTESISPNLYFISKKNSNIDIKKFIDIFKNIQHCYNLYNDNLPVEIINVANPILNVRERYINPIKVCEYFTNLFKSRLKLINNYKTFENIDSIINELNESFDLIINCTYNMLNPIKFQHYECFVTLLYKIDSTNIFAYTVMDGPFFSIYPYDIKNKIYTVTSVLYGVAYKGNNTKYILTESKLNEIKTNMDKQLTEFIPDWNKIAKYCDFFSSWKTKYDSVTDDRSIKYTYENNILNIYGGKITGIFEAEKILLSIIHDKYDKFKYKV